VEVIKRDNIQHLNQATPSSLSRIQDVGWQQHLSHLIAMPQKQKRWNLCIPILLMP
jgi:choline/glycine/proline betaine transport protein|tara:strand:+ start:708 stop:875 length:168 start_codon:yes stop_codon:yes gene_type:complete